MAIEQPVYVLCFGRKMIIMHFDYDWDELLKYYRLMPTKISNAYYEMGKCVTEIENELINNQLYFEKNLYSIIESIKSSHSELKKPTEVIIGFYKELYETYYEVMKADR